MHRLWFLHRSPGKMINLQTKRKANTGKHWWLLTLFERVIASSSPSIDWRRVGSTYVFTFSKGLQDSRKLRCCSIQLDFVAKGCTANLLNTKPKPMILIAFLSTFQSVPASRVIPSRELTCSISRYRLEEWHFPLPFWWDMWSFDPRGRASPPPLSDQTKKRVKRDRWPDPQGRSKCPPTGTRRYELYPSPIASPQKSIVCETCTDPWWLTAYCKPWPGFRWTKKVFI